MSKHYAVFYSPTVAKSSQLSLLQTAFREYKLHASFYAVDRCRVGKMVAKTDVLVAAGGDGTVNSVAAVAHTLQKPLGIVPMGTLNHFAKDLGLPLVPLQAVEVLAARTMARVDIGLVADKVFLNNASLGIYPSLVRVRTRLEPFTTKWPAALVAVLHVAIRRLHLYKLRLTVGDKTLERTSSMLFVGNNKYDTSGTGLPNRNELQDGILQAYILKTKRVDRLLKTGLYSVVGKQLPKSYIEPIEGQKLRVEIPARDTILLAYDGEVAKVALPLTFSVQPKGLQVLIKEQ